MMVSALKSCLARNKYRLAVRIYGPPYRVYGSLSLYGLCYGPKNGLDP